MMNIVSKSYESLLPFLVVEAISSQGASFNSMSVRMIDQGWAWLVTGRKLLIWKFKDSKAPSVAKARRMLSPCFELQLPQSDLNHRADLIQTFFMPQNPNTSIRAVTVPAALAVSPEGTIRFWSNIANERFTESSVAELQGLEFCTLVPLSQLEYLLGTTTGSVFILVIDITAHDSKNVLVCSTLNAPSGLLSGIGRRVTNLFFGQMTTDVGADSRKPLITVPKYSQSTIDKTGSTDRPFFVMSSTFKLRQWSRTNEGTNSCNQLIREWDLQKNVFLKLVTELGLTEQDYLNFWPIDLITTKTKELLMLIVTLDTTRDNAINYATCVFNPYQAGDSIANLTLLRSHSWHYSNESEDQLLALRFLERRTNSSICFMYDRKFLFLVKTDQDILDAVDYANQDDGILGAGIVDTHPILFTQRDGLIYVVPVACDKSRFNDTSIQLEPPPPTVPTSSNDFQQHNTSATSIKQTSMRKSDTSIKQHSISTRSLEPVLIEIDCEEEENEENNDQSARLRHSRHKDDKKQSVTNKSKMDQSNISTTNTSTASTANQSIRGKSDEGNDFLKENKEFEWVQQIDARHYGLASKTLAKLAEESEILKDRKETLLALSFLAKKAE